MKTIGKAMVVIAPKGFQDMEYSGTVSELKTAKIEVTVVSTIKGKCVGKMGLEVDASSIDEVDYKTYDSIVFIGGPGTIILRSDSRMIELAKKMNNAEKIVAAICWAPTILAKAGILKGKKATVWLGDDPEYGKDTDDVIKDLGANFIDKPVVEDGNIVTGNGPVAAKVFGRMVAEKIIALKTE